MSTILHPLQPEIAAKLGDDFERAVLAAALLSLGQAENPLRLNNFATPIRELSRIVLHRLAPDDQVAACSWYEPTMNENGKATITRADRIHYAVHAGLTAQFAKQALHIDVTTMRKDLVKAVDKLSKYTHVTPDVFGVTGDRLDALVNETLEAFLAFLEMIEECRESVVANVETHARQALHKDLLEHTVQELDELATHYSVEYAHVDTVTLSSIDACKLIFGVTGSVECHFQYGSGSDVSRGDGWVTNDSYPLTCDFESDASAPLKLRVLRSTLRVDNDSFYE